MDCLVINYYLFKKKFIIKILKGEMFVFLFIFNLYRVFFFKEINIV